MSALDIRAVRDATPISAVVAQHLKLSRTGREWKACCPFHADKTPSFTVCDEKGFAHCFGCGWHGDSLDFIQAIEKVGLREAVTRISNVPAIHRAQVVGEGRDTTAEALSIWRQAVAIQGTPAETYLRSRGVTCSLPESLRFARLHYGKRGPQHPCLIALATSADNRGTGIQRTYLNGSGTDKASVPKQKLSLGRIRGSAIRLAPCDLQMIICEGLEDGLTLQQEIGVATWVSAGVGNLKTMDLPARVRSIIIGADADRNGEVGARAAAERFVADGREVRIIRPCNGYKDFNAELRGAVS